MVNCFYRECVDTWELKKGMIDGDRLACINCGKTLSIKHDSAVSKNGDQYVLCKFCHEKMTLTPIREYGVRKYVPFEETK